MATFLTGNNYRVLVKASKWISNIDGAWLNDSAFGLGEVMNLKKWLSLKGFTLFFFDLATQIIMKTKITLFGKR